MRLVISIVGKGRWFWVVIKANIIVMTVNILSTYFDLIFCRYLLNKHHHYTTSPNNKPTNPPL